MKFRIAGVVGLAVLFAGCSSDGGRPKVVPVSGKVTKKGTPLTEGDVTFTLSGGVPGAAGAVATGQIESDGSYRLTTFNTGDGAVPGTYKVTVVARPSGDLKKMNQMKDGKIAYKLPQSLVASKYSQLDSTPLKYTVTTDGNNKIDIDLAE